MKCQKCNNNPATTHIKQVINGVKTEIYLCSECAGETPDFFSFAPNIDQEFDSLFGSFWNVPAVSKTLYEEGNCKMCGTTRSRFLKTGKPGCSKCYTVFEELLMRPLKQIHGSTKHTGKTPSQLSRTFETEDQIAALQAKLDDAVSKQNFEEAAQIRDEIRMLRGDVK
ncbi:MAG: UvrB/UvrC motif-containing protein [Clostridia bacterium]|nr:UvrB/UvrC motif-containing protein [Clostridia bacterium]